MNTETMFVVCGLLGLIPAGVAQNKGRSFALWWLYGTMVFFIAVIHATVLKNGAPVLRVTRVDSGSEAEAAGIAVDDTILSVDGKPVRTSSQLYEALRHGDSHVLAVRRGLEVLSIETGRGPLGVGLQRWYVPEHGTPVLCITRVRSGSPAAAAGLRGGDIVLTRNGAPVFPDPTAFGIALASEPRHTLIVHRAEGDVRIDVGKGPIGVRTEASVLLAMPVATARPKATERLGRWGAERDG